MNYDVIIIGAGLSGLTAASLLAKKGLKVCVVENAYKPGGSSGIFKRDDVIFDQGAAMLYGFAEKGFNAHRFVFNALEEPIDIIKHDELYAINFEDERIVFYEDLDKFINELSRVFPDEKDNLKRFYHDMADIYKKVIAESPVYVSPDVVKKQHATMQLLKHPAAYTRFLTYLNTNAKDLLSKYFTNHEIFNFFDKLTSTYCYTTVEETPAVLAAVMFVDNHFGGSYAAAGSTLNLVGKLEKAIEENDGDMIYKNKVSSIVVEDNRAKGVQLEDGSIIYGDNVIYSGNVWDLYNNLLKGTANEDELKWISSLKPSYPSLVLYSIVKEEAIPEGTLPIEMLIGDKSKLDEGELTAYILTLDDKTLCKEGYHTVITIGPTFKKWPKYNEKRYSNEQYKAEKEFEKERILNVLEKRFPGFKENLCHVEISTPTTIERYVLKHGGAVAGPKQELGQHMLKRLKTKSRIEGLYHCGESTIMGTGTPTVTVTGVSAANLILRKLAMDEYEHDPKMKNYVNIVEKPFSAENIKIGKTPKEDRIGKLALKCQFCENPQCEKECPKSVPIRDINRRVAVGNFHGGNKLLKDYGKNPCDNCYSKACEKTCIRKNYDKAVSIEEIIRGVINN